MQVKEVLFGHVAPTEISFKNQIFGFITLHKVVLNLIFFPPIVASMALAGVGIDDPRFYSMLLVSFLITSGSLILNDVVDMERDKHKWPLRPLATGLISRSTAILYAAIIAGIGLTIAAFVFSWLFAALTFMLLVLDHIYARYTRDNIGYLTVVVPIALTPVVVWTAISPETILTPIPWLLCIMGAAEASAGNIVNEAFDPGIKALITQFRPSTEIVVYCLSVFITFLGGVAIFFYTKLPWSSILVFAAITILALTQAKYLREPRNPKMLENAFRIIAIHPAIIGFSIAVFVWIR